MTVERLSWNLFKVVLRKRRAAKENLKLLDKDIYDLAYVFPAIGQKYMLQLTTLKCASWLIPSGKSVWKPQILRTPQVLQDQSDFQIRKC